MIDRFIGKVGSEHDFLPLYYSTDEMLLEERGEGGGCWMGRGREG